MVWGQLSISTPTQQQGGIIRGHLQLPVPIYPGACPSASTDRTSSPALGTDSLPVSPVPPTCLHGPTCQEAWEGGACPQHLMWGTCPHHLLSVPTHPGAQPGYP